MVAANSQVRPAEKASKPQFTQTIVTTSDGREHRFDTVSWRRRWEPTDLQLHNVARTLDGARDTNDIPTKAHIEAKHVLIVETSPDDDGNSSIMAVFNEWVSLRMV